MPAVQMAVNGGSELLIFVLRATRNSQTIMSSFIDDGRPDRLADDLVVMFT
jgi:hypothetical protein